MDALERTDKMSVRIQILCLISSHFSKDTIIKCITSVTQHQTNKSRKSYNFEIQNKEKIFRTRISHSSIDIFLDFINRENYLQDVAYGVNKIKSENSTKLCNDNVMTDGLYSYCKLNDLVNKLQCSEVKKEELFGKIEYAKNYIKFQYKNNIPGGD